MNSIYNRLKREAVKYNYVATEKKIVGFLIYKIVVKAQCNRSILLSYQNKNIGPVYKFIIKLNSSL